MQGKENKSLSCKVCGVDVEVETAWFVRDEPHCDKCRVGAESSAAHEDAEFEAAAKLRAALNECYQVGLATPDIVREMAAFFVQEAGESNMILPDLLRDTAAGLKRVVAEVWESPGYSEPKYDAVPHVLITVEGGAVQWIAATGPIAPVVFDYDARDSGEEYRHEWPADLIEPRTWAGTSNNPDGAPARPIGKV